MSDPDLSEIAGKLVRQLGLRDGCRVERLPGGRNNRVYRVEAPGADGPFLLKSYFYSDQDRRDRLGAEWSFASFAWSRGVRALPEPLVCDTGARAALFRFVEGEKPQPGTVGAAEVDQALAFIRDVNRRRDEAAADLPVASEACFSIADHVTTIERRLQRLHGLDVEDDLSAALRSFVGEDVIPLFRAIVADLQGRVQAKGITADYMLAPRERILSPSDFGFHNALRDAEGTVRFLDFEYAGWDDPAKLVGDFFNQVAVPVPDRCYAPFVEGLIEALQLRSVERLRFDLFRRLYAIKWTVIVLNEFIRTDRQRRAYAGGPVRESHLAGQFALARQKIAALRETV